MLNKALTILIADDDEEDIELIEEAIMNTDKAVALHKVKDGRAALDYLLHQDTSLPCLIVLDYNMPELTGAQVLSALCDEPRYQAIPKVVLSTSNTPRHIQECRDNGAREYFVKPSTASELNQLATKLVALCCN